MLIKICFIKFTQTCQEKKYKILIVIDKNISLSDRGVCFKFCYEEVAIIVCCFFQYLVLVSENFVNRDGAVKRYYNADNLEKNDDIF